jgi:hypothetical protein
MRALALQSCDDLPRPISSQPEAFRGQSREAQQISERTSEVLFHLSKANTYESAKIDAIKRLTKTLLGDEPLYVFDGSLPCVSLHK